jgi:murein DD-endopeptidase MepM/ murein hydrolase activator NlpD
MTTFRTLVCFSSSLLTILSSTQVALAATPGHESWGELSLESADLGVPESLETFLVPEMLLPDTPLPAAESTLPPPETEAASLEVHEPEPAVIPPTRSSVTLPEFSATPLEADAAKLEWARQKLLGQQLSDALAAEHEESLAAAIAAAEAEAEPETTSKVAQAPATNPVPSSDGAAPRWVATSMPLSVTFPDFSIQNFLNLPLRLPGNGNIRALFPLSIPAPISSLFGWRQHPIFGDLRLHQGIDLAAPMGTPVLAAFSGTVKTADFLGGYGLTVILEHDDGTQETLYAHLSEILVEPGTWVEQGMAIGRVGSTGNSTGPHLHFEFRQLTEQGWVALDVNAMMKEALANFGAPTIALLETDIGGPRKNPKKLHELGALAGRVTQPQAPTYSKSESIFRGV